MRQGTFEEPLCKEDLCVLARPVTVGHISNVDPRLKFVSFGGLMSSLQVELPSEMVMLVESVVHMWRRLMVIQLPDNRVNRLTSHQLETINGNSDSLVVSKNYPGISNMTIR